MFVKKKNCKEKVGFVFIMKYQCWKKKNVLTKPRNYKMKIQGKRKSVAEKNK